MKNYLYLLAISLSLTACSEDDFNRNITPEPLPELTTGSVDFSTYVAIGASFTAGYTDGALFMASQNNSFPNILSQQFSVGGGGSFTQPLMNDNIGGFLFGGAPLLDAQGNNRFPPRLYFNGTGPVRLSVASTTEATTNTYASQGPFNNIGVPGAKSFHVTFNGYGALNPYFGRMASSATASMLEDALLQNPTFFTLSEISGNDVLGYATSGGESNSTASNYDPITPTAQFDAAFHAIVDGLTLNGAKGVVANVPYITSLPHFTRVPYNPLEPSNPAFGPQIPLLNSIYGALNQIFLAVGQPNRVVVFSETEDSAVVIYDETLTDLSATITGALAASPTFPAFIAQFGLPPQAVPLVAGLLGATYGQSRQATADDLFVLPSSSIIGTVNNTVAAALIAQNLPPALAGQFAVEGVSLPLADKWVLIPSEQLEIKTATDAYNVTIQSVASANNLALIDFKLLLQQASTTGISDSNFTLTTDLVTGGLVGLDGIHLTSRGYALLANKFLEAIDATYGSNFIAAGVKANIGDYPTNYSPMLQ